MSALSELPGSKGDISKLKHFSLWNSGMQKAALYWAQYGHKASINCIPGLEWAAAAGPGVRQRLAGGLGL